MVSILRSFISSVNIPQKSQFLGAVKTIWQPQLQQKRHLNVHEYVSYTLLKGAGIGVPKFFLCTNKEEAVKAGKEIKSEDLVVKAQVLAGGRGKGTFKNGLKSGVRMASTPKEVGELAEKMIGQILVTKQTGDIGKICNKVMVTQRKYPRREFYFAFMMERAFNGPVLIASSEGGVNIEEVAASNPKAIFYEPIDICQGIQLEQATKIAKKVGMGDAVKSTADMLMNMYDLFIKKDALLVEINPYAQDACQEYFALDCKMRFDDNAEFRQKELFSLRDLTQEDPKEVAASKFNLNYIALDGNIGCMVNGAGLAMATMDIIKLNGGDPANFLDVGGSATAPTVKEAFKIITSDPKVKAILVNIFGGIMKCDIIAEGIIAAAKELDLKIPVVCRLQGTNVREGMALLESSKLKILAINDLDKAADLVVKLSTIVKLAEEARLEVSFKFPHHK